MLTELADSKKIVGIKQSTKAVNDGVVLKAYVANGIDPNIKTPFVKLCNKKDIPVIVVATGKELGEACQIDVSASVAVILKD